jgi:hypothetical protein
MRGREEGGRVGREEERKGRREEGGEKGETVFVVEPEYERWAWEVSYSGGQEVGLVVG